MSVDRGSDLHGVGRAGEIGSEAIALPNASQANTQRDPMAVIYGLRARLELAFTASRLELIGDVAAAARCRQLIRDPELAFPMGVQ